MIDLYDIRRKSISFADGVDTPTWTVTQTIKLEVQPIRVSKGQRDDLVAIEIGGEQYIPNFYAWAPDNCEATATDHITSNSGTILYLVLRTYDYEDHKEMDLRQVAP